MIQDEEFEVRQMFLEEAQEYLNLIEDILIGLDHKSPRFRQQVDSVLRAAHSLKGGSAMMQFNVLSDTAHRLEDSFQLLRTNRPAVDSTVKILFSRSVDLLRQIVTTNRLGKTIEPYWIKSKINPLFNQLEQALNTSPETNSESSDEEEEEINIAVMLFESEVENSLVELEAKLAAPELSEDFQAELIRLANELAGIGEMLELTNFALLNQAIAEKLEAVSSSQIAELAQAALSIWQRSQALVVTGNSDSIPSTFNFDLTEPSSPEILETTSLQSELSSHNLNDRDSVELIGEENEENNELPQIDLFDDFSSNIAVNNDLENNLNLEILLASTHKDNDELEFVLDTLPIANPEFIETSLPIAADFQIDNLAGSSTTIANSNLPFELIPFDDLDINLGEVGGTKNSNSLNLNLGSQAVLIIEIEEDGSSPFSLGTQASEDLFAEFQMGSNIHSYSQDDVSLNPQREVITDGWDENLSLASDETASKNINSDIWESFSQLGDNNSIDLFSNSDNERSLENLWTNLDDLLSENNFIEIKLEESSERSELQSLVVDSDNDEDTLITNSLNAFYTSSINEDLLINRDPEPSLISKSFSTINNTNGVQELNGIIPEFWDNLENIENELSELAITDNLDISSFNIKTEKAIVSEKPHKFFAYVTPDLEPESIPTQDLNSRSLNKDLKLGDSLNDLFDDLDASQEEDAPIPLPEIKSDLVSAYLKDTGIRIPIAKLEQVNNLAEQVEIEHSGLDVKLRNLRGLSKVLNMRIRSLEQANTQLIDICDRISMQNSMESQQLFNSLDSSKELEQHDRQLLNQDSDFQPEFDSLELDRYTNLHSLSQALTETIAQFEEVSEDIELTIEEAEQDTVSITSGFKQLQHAVTQLRMRPLSEVTSRFLRVIRSLSLQYGKQVDISIQGDDILVDRAILDMLNDPLNHLLRNAFDHGIEEASIRTNRGKSEEGHIIIKCSQQADQLLITISDDGGGIDIDKIRIKAERAAMSNSLSTSKIDTSNEEELLSLIFEPGFSTAEEVTSLSGRGVGMDVVLTNLKQIGAEIKVNTKAEIGTTFTITVPITLSSLRIVLIEINNLFLAMPSNLIQEVVPFQAEHVQYGEDRDLLIWQDKSIPIIYPQAYLKLNCIHQSGYLEDKPSTATSAFLVLEYESKLISIQVDACWGEQEVSIRHVEGNIPLPSVFSGCITLGNHQAVPLLNISNLISSLSNSKDRTTEIEPIAIATQDSTDRPNSSKFILVVDDSINVRRYLALTLEKAGFRIEQAKDGEDAWHKLSKGLNVDAIISDVEMPHLSGYGLLSRLRSQENYQKLPVIMLTSRGSDKHRQLAMRLGATAYFTKPYQELELVQSLQTLIK